MDSPQAPTLAVPRDLIGSRHYAVGVPEFQNGSFRHDALIATSGRPFGTECAAIRVS